jgi:hypothetical protein
MQHRGVDDVDIHPPDTGVALADDPPTHGAAGAAASQDDMAAQLRAVAVTAAGLTTLLDSLRGHHPANGLRNTDPVAAALEQAAAAAHDLHISATIAADAITEHG